MNLVSPQSSTVSEQPTRLAPLPKSMGAPLLALLSLVLQAAIVFIVSANLIRAAIFSGCCLTAASNAILWWV